LKEIYYTYNNEAIGSCTILQYLQNAENISLAHSCLILPFLLDDRTVRQLNSTNSDMTISEFITSKPHLFTSFNRRFLNLLPITINSCVLLSKSKKIDIGKNISIKSQGMIPDNIYLGNRFHHIRNAVRPLSKILDEKDVLLYKTLQIQL
jgi:hypothetical protein